MQALEGLDRAESFVDPTDPGHQAGRVTGRRWLRSRGGPTGGCIGGCCDARVAHRRRLWSAPRRLAPRVIHHAGIGTSRVLLKPGFPD